MASPILLLCSAFALVLLTLCLRGTRGIDLSLGFIQEPGDVIGERNHPLIINCSAYSGAEYGPVDIRWRLKGVIINDSRREVLSNGSLYFHRLIHQKKTGESDAGEYQCIASNSVGSLSRTIRLSIANISRKFITEPQKQMTVEEGDLVRFSCQIAAVPPPVFSWQKNRENLPQNDDRLITLKNSGILLINEVKLSDTGIYRCAATNLASRRRSADVSLVVKAATKMYRAPVILTPRHTVKVKSGEEAILECTASGYPTPVIKWDRFGGIRSSGVDTKAPGMLVFTKTLPNDGGEYTCNASNRDPVTNKLYSVTQMIILQVLVAPTIVKSPQSLVVTSVQTARFECEAIGQPLPTIRWLKNGQQVHSNGRIKIKKSLNSFEFVILQTANSDSGLYQCIAENEAGRSNADARLKVNMSRDQPDPPTGLSAKTLSSTSIELHWNASTKRNGLQIQAYTVHYSPTQGGDELQKVAVSRSQTIDMLRPFTNYTIYIRAYNGRSASDPSVSIIWTTGDDIPLAAPTVTLKSSSATTLHVFWEQMPNHESRGKIITYKIQWRRKNFPSPNVLEIPGSNYEYTITGLIPSTKYEVRVMGATRAAYPNLSDEMWPWVQHMMPAQGYDGVPAAPILDLSAINSTAIKVRWQMSQNDDVAVHGFKIAYRRENLKIQGPFTIGNNTTTHYLLTDLDPHTTYEIHLMAFNGFGNGRESVRHVQTLEGTQSDGNSEMTYVLVESPSNLEAKPKNSTSINVKWSDPVSDKNISYFTVRYGPVRYSNMNASSVSYINSTSKQVLITDLIPYMLYEFSVRSHSEDNVEGPYSSKVECKTGEDIPTAPLELNWTPLDTQSVRLTWKPPKFPNGVITNYYVMYNVNKEYFCQPDKWLTKEEKGTELSSVLNGLMSNKVYYFCMRAKTSAGLGQASELISLKIPTAPLRNQSSIQPMLKDEIHDPQLGIVLGVSIGVGCMIICAFIVIFRNRCFPPTLEPLPHHYMDHNHSHNGHVISERGVGMDAREMESFMPMLAQVTANTHLDTKGGYPMTCCNGKRNGYSHSILRNAYVISGRLKRNKLNMNITENPQHTTWYLTRTNYHNRESPLLDVQVVDEDDASSTSDGSRNEDSGVQLAPSQETESFNQDSRSSSRGSEMAERNSASAVPEAYAISAGDGESSGCHLPRSRSWDTLFKHSTPPL